MGKYIANKTTKLELILTALISVITMGLAYRHIGPFTPLETLGFLTGAINVWWLVKNNVWSWPFAIINGAIYVYIFYQFNLFADGIINMFYVFAGMWGWYYWLHEGTRKIVRPITHVPVKEMAILLGVLGLITWLEYPHLVHLGDTAPFLDALTTAMSIIAFYMQCKRYIENWWVWIAADFIYIPLYMVKGLPLTAALYTIFMVMCFIGVVSWYREYRQVHKPKITIPANLEMVR